MSATPDTALLGQVRPGEPLANLDRRFRPALLAYFRRRVANRAEAEDLTQDVFERVLRTTERAPVINADALVFRIAVNLMRDQARSARRHGIERPLAEDTLDDLAGLLSVDLSPERVLIGERTLEEAISALNELSERTRAMFYLYRLEHLKIREIAEIYGISASGVEKNFARALLHLMQRLQLR
jgi:RNA polymerase sigma-70 factor (ECF subfamily)